MASSTRKPPMFLKWLHAISFMRMCIHTAPPLLMDTGGFQSFMANNCTLSNTAQMETPRNIAAGSRGNCMGNLIDTVKFLTVGAPISNKGVSVFPGWAGGGGGCFSKGGTTWPLGQLESLGPQGPSRGGNTGCLRAVGALE